MTQFVYIQPRSRSGTLTLSEVATIADSLKRGSPAVLPTETGYMLAALATSEDAVKSAFMVKGRVASAVMHVACASLEMAQAVGVLTDRAMRLLGKFTPGPLSVIVNKTGLLPDDLVAVNGTVGIRIPDHPATLQVINAVGSPVTATSLNSSGSQLASVDETSLRALNWPDNETVYVVLDDDAVAYSSASTLVRVSGESIEVLRLGPISESQIHEVAVDSGLPPALPKYAPEPDIAVNNTPKPGTAPRGSGMPGAQRALPCRGRDGSWQPRRVLGVSFLPRWNR